MPKTKAQKVKAVAEGVKELKTKETLVFADFKGVSTEETKRLRRALYPSGGKFTVFKKRLLRVMFQELGIDVNPKEFEGQVGTVMSSKDISEVAGTVFKFSKETIGADKQLRFKILGGYDLKAKRFLPGDEVRMIGALPPREVLLGQLVGAISGPLRAFLYVLSEKAKKSN